MGALEDLLPVGITSTAVTSGHEFFLPRSHAQKAIEIATEHRIAVLGLECFRLFQDGCLSCLDYTDYNFGLRGNWAEFVCLNNEEAARFVANPVAEDIGYILTSTSEAEYSDLR